MNNEDKWSRLAKWMLSMIRKVSCWIAEVSEASIESLFSRLKQMYSSWEFPSWDTKKNKYVFLVWYVEIVFLLSQNKILELLNLTRCKSWFVKVYNKSLESQSLKTSLFCRIMAHKPSWTWNPVIPSLMLSSLYTTMSQLFGVHVTREWIHCIQISNVGNS